VILNAPLRREEFRARSADLEEDGTPVLRIGTKNLPDLAFAIGPDQLEEIEAWLGSARMALQGRKPQ